MSKLLKNISKCANNTINDDKYEWLFPIVPVFNSFDIATKNGLDVGKHAWYRAVKIYSNSNDITAKQRQCTKLCLFLYQYTYLLYSETSALLCVSVI